MKALAILVAVTGVAQAQATDIAVPDIVLDDVDEATMIDDSALDLANIVQSAAKGITTVQEAPAIVTVITADEIKDRQFQDLTQLYDTVPGWYRMPYAYSALPVPLVRGQVQAVQFLHDGVSLFDPFVNIPASNRIQPMELVKRVEMITGPGGVLWGSNSLLGILNIITKDAEDVDGVEVGGQIGDGRGDRRMGRAYLMAGASNDTGTLKAFIHGSIETYRGQTNRMPLLLFHGALPQPNSPNIYGPLVDSEQPRSMLANLFAKVTLGKLQLRVSYPFSERYNPSGLSGNPVREDLPQDPSCPIDSTDPVCVDPRGASRRSRGEIMDRYAVAEYRTRFADDKAGVTARAYLIEFVRGFNPLQILAPSETVPGGLSFRADLTSYRGGAGIDGDVELTRTVRLLYGAEAFHELKQNNVTTSRQGDGTQSEILAPYQLQRLPVLCPRIYDQGLGALVPIPGCPLTFAFPADRTVLGAYVNPQWRPNKKLIFDVGARVQAAPAAFGELSYEPNITLAASGVWAFIPGWHFKLNYAQGFRPPVFNNTTSNGEGVQIGGDPNLGVETSDAVQAEVNARIWKGQRRIRELSFRIDGSYTRLEDQIQVSSGQYTGTGQRGIASVEFLGKLYVQGGHRLEVGYTFLQVNSSDRGRIRALPEHWFNLAGVFALVGDKLSATGNLKIAGAHEDPNRLVEFRNATFDEMGNVEQNVIVAATDLVVDRIPPTAELTLGMQWTPVRQLAIRGTIYNAFQAQNYAPDPVFDYEPHLEYLPNPYEGFRAYLSAVYAY